MSLAAGVRADSIVDEWMLARLNGDATLRSILSVPTGSTRVASMLAPRAWGDGPMVVYQQQLPLRTTRAIAGGGRILAAGEYLVRALGRPTAWRTLASAADRLDALLDGQSGTTSTGRVVACHHVEPYRLEEVDTPEGAEPRAVWLHVGALWRVEVSS